MSKEGMNLLTLEDALRVFDHAALATIRRTSASVYLTLRHPVYHVAVRRKATETFAEMLIRCASKAVENQTNGIESARFVSARCQLCGQVAKKTTKLCYRCEHCPADPQKAEEHRLKQIFDEYTGLPQ